MIDEKLFADLVELYEANVKIYKEKNTGLIIDNVRPLELEKVEKEFDPKKFIDRAYIKTHYINFTVNPQVTKMDIKKDGVTHIELSPDISWEREIHDD